MKGRNPNKAEKEWLAKITRLGCIVCWLEHGVETQASPHHIAGKTKPGAHMKTIPLCGLHHQGGQDCPEYTSRHPHKARFEARYGTEDYLLEKTKELIG